MHDSLEKKYEQEDSRPLLFKEHIISCCLIIKYSRSGRKWAGFVHETH